MHIREGKRSSWKKHTFVLRASGLYYSKSGKSLASKDIVRVVEWKDVKCYTGNQYKKFYRAPGNFCFSLVVRMEGGREGGRGGGEEGEREGRTEGK